MHIPFIENDYDDLSLYSLIRHLHGRINKWENDARGRIAELIREVFPTLYPKLVYDPEHKNLSLTGDEYHEPSDDEIKYITVGNQVYSVGGGDVPEDIEERIESLEDTIPLLQNQIDDVEQTTRNLGSSINLINNRVTNLGGQLNDLQAEYDSTVPNLCDAVEDIQAELTEETGLRVAGDRELQTQIDELKGVQNAIMDEGCYSLSHTYWHVDPDDGDDDLADADIDGSHDLVYKTLDRCLQRMNWDGHDARIKLDKPGTYEITMNSLVGCAIHITGATTNPLDTIVKWGHRSRTSAGFVCYNMKLHANYIHFSYQETHQEVSSMAYFENSVLNFGDCIWDRKLLMYSCECSVSHFEVGQIGMHHTLLSVLNDIHITNKFSNDPFPGQAEIRNNADGIYMNRDSTLYFENSSSIEVDNLIGTPGVEYSNAIIRAKGGSKIIIEAGVNVPSGGGDVKYGYGIKGGFCTIQWTPGYRTHWLNDTMPASKANVECAWSIDHVGGSIPAN